MDTNPHRPCFVYLLRAGEAVKIGIAVNIGSRLAALQSGNPLPIEIVGRRMFISTGAAVEAERALHSRFQDSRAQGEWFWITPQQAVAALDHYSPIPRREEGPRLPAPAAVPFDYGDQLRLMADATFYTEA